MSFCHVPSPPSTYPFLEASQSVAYPSRHFVNAENRERESVARKEERGKRRERNERVVKAVEVEKRSGVGAARGRNTTRRSSR